MDDLSVFNSSSALSSKDLDRSSNRSFNASLLAFSLTDFFTFFTGLVVVFFVAVAVVSAMVVTAATSAEANACFPNDVFVVVVVVVVV
jgi:dolichol kinase